MTNFTELNLPSPLLKATNDLGYQTATKIQEMTIPRLLKSDEDIIGLAQTGTGKTAAFGLPIIAKIDSTDRSVQALILCPTRELCIQLCNDFISFSKYTANIKCAAIYGGASIRNQKAILKSGAQIVIGTPGRIADMINQNVLKINRINHLVLDEADEMLNIGFKDDILKIISYTPQDRQTLLFSATMSKEVNSIAKTIMRNPHKISVDSKNIGAENITHFYYKVNSRSKYQTLKRITDLNPDIYGIVFCKTRNETKEIAKKLQSDGYNAEALHGELSQSNREEVMSRFRSKYIRLLVATDVAARGLDINNVSHIINYQLPPEPEVYIHRTGRTGRAGKNGIAISITQTKDANRLRAIEKHLGKEIAYAKTPSNNDIYEKQLFNYINAVEQVSSKHDQLEEFLPKVFKKLSCLSKEEIIQRFVTVEFENFLNYYKVRTKTS